MRNEGMSAVTAHRRISHHNHLPSRHNTKAAHFSHRTGEQLKYNVESRGKMHVVETLLRLEDGSANYCTFSILLVLTMKVSSSVF